MKERFVTEYANYRIRDFKAMRDEREDPFFRNFCSNQILQIKTILSKHEQGYITTNETMKLISEV